MKTVSNSDDGAVKFVFCVIKTRANDTNQTNYSRMCNADISRITVRYGSSEYPRLSQNANWSLNSYSRFYKEFLKVSTLLGNPNLALSMSEFKDLYTVYSIDISAQPAISSTNSLVIDCERRLTPAAGDATLANPRDIEAFFIIITEARIEIDCLQKVVRKK